MEKGDVVKVERIDSLSGKYYLSVRHIFQGIGFHERLMIEVYHSNGTKINESPRNYGSLGPIGFLEELPEDYEVPYTPGNKRIWYKDMQHRMTLEYTGTPIVILSEDYSGGYGYMDLVTGNIYHTKKADCWCWMNCKFDMHQGKRTLVVHGCIWGCEFEFKRFDLGNPQEFPWPEMDRWPDE